MKNIHLIKTDKLSALGKFIDTNNLFLRNRNDIPRGQNVHIYITTDEDIKEGDWFIRGDEIHRCFRVHKTDIEFLTSIDSVYCGSNTFWNKEYCKKIILTTDKYLIRDGVQSIDDDFLQWFVQNPSCEQVKIKSDWEFLGDDYRHGGSQTMVYKIIIPQEEPKQTDENGKPLTFWGGLKEPKQEIEQQIAITKAIGEKTVKYLEKYKGQSIYNEIALAIEFGYQLKVEEDE